MYKLDGSEVPFSWHDWSAVAWDVCRGILGGIVFVVGFVAVCLAVAMLVPFFAR